MRWDGRALLIHRRILHMSPVPVMASQGRGVEEGAGAAGMSRGVGGGQGRRASTGGLEYFRGTNFIYIMGIILLAKSKLEGESERVRSCPPPPILPAPSQE